MSRYTTFRYALDPTATQAASLARHAGASRFAFNQCLRLVMDALEARKNDPAVNVPWTGFDLMNAFQAWKRSEAAGRVTAPDGTVQAVGLPWRNEVCQQVFDQAAVDLSRGLAAWAASRNGERRGHKIEFPRFKRKIHSRDSFRIREKSPQRPRIYIGRDHPRSVTLPVLGTIRVHNDTRNLRRLLRPIPQHDPHNGEQRLVPRARILSATVAREADRWYVMLTIEAPDLHAAARHPTRTPGDPGEWVGIDRGLTSLVVAALGDRTEAGRFGPPRPLVRNLPRLRRLNRTVHRRQKGSTRRRRAARAVARRHARIANQRNWWLHQISNQLSKTHSKLVLETLSVRNLLRNHRLARSISDAGWGELQRQLAYKQRWRGGELRLASRWLASSKTCSSCGWIRQDLTLSDRVFRCDRCGLDCDRDLNASANLAVWAEMTAAADAQAPDLQAAGRATNARGGRSTTHRDTGRHLGPAKREPVHG